MDVTTRIQATVAWADLVITSTLHIVGLTVVGAMITLAIYKIVKGILNGIKQRRSD